MRILLKMYEYKLGYHHRIQPADGQDSEFIWDAFVYQNYFHISVYYGVLDRSVIGDLLFIFAISAKYLLSL